VLRKVTEAFANTYRLFQGLLKNFVKIWVHSPRNPRLNSLRQIYHFDLYDDMLLATVF